MARSFDAALAAEAVAFFLKTEEIPDVIEWLANKNNIMLHNSDEDTVLFECWRPGIVTGHYYLRSRGRSAIASCRDFLDEIFNPCYNIKVIRGLSPLTNLGARWMNRHLGLTSHGVVNTTSGLHELFIIDREQYERSR